MDDQDTSKMTVEELRQIYKNIFFKYGTQGRPHELGDFKRADIQEVCEAGPEVFTQWLTDHEDERGFLESRYKNIERPEEIASKGAAVWNCWQIDQYRKREHGDISMGEDIMLHDLFNTRSNFQGFYFYQPVKCSGRIEKKTNFYRTVFNNSATFSQSIFTEEAIFREANFFNGVDFNYTKFIHNALFEGAKFRGTVIFFQGVDFQKEVNFMDSEFYGYTIFQGAKFKKHYVFQEGEHSILLDTLSNFGKINFSRGKFFGSVGFQGAEFHSGVIFMGTEFNMDVNFQNVSFHGDAQFHNCKFLGPTNFNTDIVNSEKGVTKSKQTKFAKVPEFYNAELHQDTGIIQARFPDPDGRDESRRAYRTLKLAFSKYQSVREEQFFYQKEIREEQEQLRRELKRGKNWKNWFIGFSEKRLRYFSFCLYKYLSDYGFSITRPFVALVVTFLFSWALYSMPGCMTGSSCSQSVWNATAISAAYTLPPLIAEWMVREKVQALFSLTAAMGIFLIIQRLVSLLLWFFIFLYWRNMARSR